MAHFSKDLAIELWVLYSLGLVLVACRMAARRIHLRSFKKFQHDDYIMLFIVLTFTGVFVSAYEIAGNGSNYVYYPPGAVEGLNPKQLTKAIWGSKMTLVLEEFTLTTLWLIKACILLMYSRLTLGLRQNVAVKILACYCLLGFIILQVLLLAVWCKPIQQYWAVPVQNSQCATYYHHKVVAVVFNISSDLMMLLIPLPLLITSRLRLKRKLVLCLVFSLGIFVILAAVLNRYYNLTDKYSLVFLNWYIGEVATAVIVANIPLCWPLLRRLFAADAWGGSRTPRNDNTSATNRRSSSKRTHTRAIINVGVETSSSNTKTLVGMSENGERNMGFWEPLNERDSELAPIPNTTGLETTVVAEMDSEHGRGELGSSRTPEAFTKVTKVSQPSC